MPGRQRQAGVSCRAAGSRWQCRPARTAGMEGDACCADSLGTADKATSLVGPAPLSEAVGSPEALGVWWKCSLALG